jgi:hypothetical protein
MAVRVYLAYSAEPLNNSLREKLWEQIAAEPIATTAKPTKGRVPAVRRWAFGGVAAAVAIGGIAFFALPGTPGQPTVAFAQVEAAMAQVRTATWTETVSESLALYPDGRYEIRLRPQTATVWARLEPPTIARRTTAEVRHIANATETYQISNRKGQLSYNRFASGIPASPMLGPTAEQTPQERVHSLILFNRPIGANGNDEWIEKQPYESQRIKREAWKSQSIIWNGQNALRFENRFTIEDKNPKDTTKRWKQSGEEWVFWVDPKTYRILRREIKTLYSYGDRKVFLHRNNENFVYDRTPPQGIFDIKPPVGIQYSFAPLPEGQIPTPSEQAAMQQTATRAVTALNHCDTVGFLAEWDFDYEAAHPIDRLQRERKQQGIVVSPPLRNIKVLQWHKPTTRTFSRFLQKTASTPFPPTMSNEFHLTGWVRGTNTAGKNIEAFLNFNLHRDGTNFKIIRMYPPYPKQLPKAKPSGMGKRPAGRP